MTEETKNFFNDNKVAIAIIIALLLLIALISVIVLFMNTKKKHNTESKLKLDMNEDLKPYNNKLPAILNQENDVKKISGQVTGNSNNFVNEKLQRENNNFNENLYLEEPPKYSSLKAVKKNEDVLILENKEDFQNQEEINGSIVDEFKKYLAENSFSKKPANDDKNNKNKNLFGVSSKTINDLFKTSAIIPLIKDPKSGKLDKINITPQDIQDYKNKRLVLAVGIKRIDGLGNTVFHDHAKTMIYKNIDQFMAFAALIHASGDENFLNRKNLNGEVPMHFAIINKHGDYKNFIEKLIVCGADINIGNRDEENALHLAIRHDNQDLVELFIDNDADLNKKNKDGDTPLNLAIKMNHFEIAKLLMQRGADVLSQNNDGNTALHALIEVVAWYEKNNHEVLQYDRLLHLLLKNKEIINIQNKNGDTPLHVAAKEGDYRIAQFLVDAGCEMDIKNKNGDTPLYIAIRGGEILISDLLIKSNADLKVKNNDGDNALHLSVRGQYFGATKDILEGDCDINGKNNAEETPLDIAVKNESAAFIKLLIEDGAVKSSAVDGKKTDRKKAPQLLKSFDEDHPSNKENDTVLNLDIIKEGGDNECC